MSIYKNDRIIETFPACDIVERDPQGGNFGPINITADDKLALVESDYLKHYQAGSVVSYALANNDCPIEAIERTRRNMEQNPAAGHCLQWINSLSASITSHKRAKETYVAVHLGMLVKFEGRLATLEADNNDNLKFVDA